MKDVIYLLFHLLNTLAKLAKPGGSRAVIAENLLPKQQRAPNLTTQDRKDAVRRVLAIQYKPDSADSGPSRLTTLGHAKGSLLPELTFYLDQVN